jgi:hypothetical protein
VDEEELDDLTVDIELLDPDDIGSRLVLLSALGLWPGLDAHEREQWYAWLKLEEVFAVAEHWEIEELRSPSDEGEDISEESVEAMVPLAWSVGLIPELPARSEPEVLEAILEGLPVPQERLEPFLDGLILLDEEQIAVQREIAEIWRWRASAEISLRLSQGVLRVEVLDAIREVVMEVAAVGLVPENDGNDFLVDGVAVRDLDAEQLDRLLMTTDERLRALNWVCGLTEWDQIEIGD